MEALKLSVSECRAALPVYRVDISFFYYGEKEMSFGLSYVVFSCGSVTKNEAIDRALNQASKDCPSLDLVILVSDVVSIA